MEHPELFSNNAPIFESDLQLNEEDIAHQEVRNALSSLRQARAAGPDNLPSDLWKALLCNFDTIEELRNLLNMCWRNKSIPEQWKHASITTIFKKGNVANSKNYRLISLLCVGYKLLASILLRRIYNGRSENHMHQTQYKF